MEKGTELILLLRKNVHAFIKTNFPSIWSYNPIHSDQPFLFIFRFDPILFVSF